MNKKNINEMIGYDKNILLGIDVDGHKIKPYIHAWNNRADYTLCGLGNCEDFKYTDRKINCPDCIALIEYCKHFKKGKDYK